MTVMSWLSMNSAPDHCRCERKRPSAHRTSPKYAHGRTDLLMSEHVAPNVPLPPLDELDVGLHTLLGERGREQVRDVRVRVQTAELETKKRK